MVSLFIENFLLFFNIEMKPKNNLKIFLEITISIFSICFLFYIIYIYTIIYIRPIFKGLKEPNFKVYTIPVAYSVFIFTKLLKKKIIYFHQQFSMIPHQDFEIF